MKKKIYSDTEIELDIEPGNCEECYYNHICTYLKNPASLDERIDFQDFCMIYIQNEGMNDDRPAPGTLEENFPDIFPNAILDKIKENKELKNTLNNYCEFFCSFECIPECPLKKYKKK